MHQQLDGWLADNMTPTGGRKISSRLFGGGGDIRHHVAPLMGLMGNFWGFCSPSDAAESSRKLSQAARGAKSKSLGYGRWNNRL